MRVLLFTGKGGVGKTTAAAGTAALAARRGLKTLVVSTDPAGSLPDAFGHPVGPEPTELADGLAAQQVDTHRLLEQHWQEIQRYLLELFDESGLDPIAAEEVTLLPGAEEVLALLALRDAAADGRWDCLVVDCAPTSEALRLLALPEALTSAADRLFGLERRLARLAKLAGPLLGDAAGLMPDSAVLAAFDRLQSGLGEVRRLLTGPQSSVRLVLTPEAVVLAEARRTYTTLAMHGYRVDGVLANRVFPTDAVDPFLTQWSAAQGACLAEAEVSFAPVPVRQVSYRPYEPVGAGALADLLADAYGEDDPLDDPPAAEPLTVTRDGDSYVLSLALPLVDRADVTLARSGDELVLTVAGRRRLVTLPSMLRRCEVTGAELVSGRLRIDFRPDPETWMAP